METIVIIIILCITVLLIVFMAIRNSKSSCGEQCSEVIFDKNSKKELSKEITKWDHFQIIKKNGCYHLIYFNEEDPFG